MAPFVGGALAAAVITISYGAAGNSLLKNMIASDNIMTSLIQAMP